MILRAPEKHACYNMAMRSRVAMVLVLLICAIGEATFAQTPSETISFEAVSPRERAALIALYRASGGESWKDRKGWLGAPGTECDWSGVICDHADIPAVVTSLHLFENGLRGTLPREIDDLTSLNELLLFGNELSGSVPPCLLEKFDSGRLRFLGYAEQFSSVSAIHLEMSPTGVICGDYEAVIRRDGAATLKQKFCRNASEQDRFTYWETQTGFIDRFAGDFDRLARLSETLHLEKFAGLYERSMTHAAFETLTIERDAKGEITIRDYGESGPASVWLMKRAIAGALFNADWESVERSTPIEE